MKFKTNIISKCQDGENTAEFKYNPGEIRSDDRNGIERAIDNAKTWYYTTPFFDSAVWDALKATAGVAAGGAAINKIAKLAKSAYLARAAKLTEAAADKASAISNFNNSAPGQVFFKEIGRYATPDDAYYANKAAQAVGKAGVDQINNMLSSTSRIFK